MSLQIATWNVNSLRMREAHLLRWLAEAGPDVVCLQELKLSDPQFPAEALAAAGYPHCAWYGQRTYNGVAIISRHPLEDVQKGMRAFDDPQRRVIAATVQGIRIYGLYVVNGQQVGSDKFHHKLRWLDHLLDELTTAYQPSDPLLVCGDFNIAPDDIDVWDPFARDGKLLCHPEERRRLQRLLDWGMHDTYRELHPFGGEFSWWDYRQMGWERNHGMRIDYVLISSGLRDRLTAARIDRHLRGWKQPSDHAPAVATLS